MSRLFQAKITVENKLLQSKERYSSLVNSVDESIYLVDREGRYLYVSSKHCQRMGISYDEFSGMSYADLHSREDTAFFTDMVGKIFSSGRSLDHEYKSRKSGHYYLQTFSPVKSSYGKVTAVTVISKDITQRKLMEEKLRTLSFTDELTGLLNRRGFFMFAEKQLSMARREQRGILLLSADLDNFKNINDTFGHGTGDEVLVDIATTLKTCYRESDIIGRIGGDEFVILVRETDETNMDELIRRLELNVHDYNDSMGKPYTLSVSIGVARYDPLQPLQLNELLSSADRLMYAMKKQTYSRQ
jgi:diguanylate cyclase (GGDEF)-like protein/PAS domain S-box-containing protein